MVEIIDDNPKSDKDHNKLLILSCRRSLLYRNQSIDLHCKSMDCVLYDWELCQEIDDEGMEHCHAYQ